MGVVTFSPGAAEALRLTGCLRVAIGVQGGALKPWRFRWSRICLLVCLHVLLGGQRLPKHSPPPISSAANRLNPLPPRHVERSAGSLKDVCHRLCHTWLIHTELVFSFAPSRVLAILRFPVYLSLIPTTITLAIVYHPFQAFYTPHTQQSYKLLCTKRS